MGERQQETTIGGHRERQKVKSRRVGKRDKSGLNWMPGTAASNEAKITMLSSGEWGWRPPNHQCTQIQTLTESDVRTQWHWHTHAHMPTYIQTKHTHTHRDTHTHTHTYIHTETHTHTHRDTHTQTHTHIHTETHTHTHTHIHTETHTHLHTETHTHRHARKLSLSLSLKHTHTHTYTLSPCEAFLLPAERPLSPSSQTVVAETHPTSALSLSVCHHWIQ